MFTARNRSRSASRSRSVGLWVWAAIIWAVPGVGLAPPAPQAHAGEDRSRGEEIFAREWLPNDPRSPAGDGLGPVFNDTSCLACHHLGGPGGAGPDATSVQILTIDPSKAIARPPAELHPGLRTSQTTILHRFAVDDSYKRWLINLLGQEHLFDMREQWSLLALATTEPIEVRMGRLRLKNGLFLSRRNPPSLFGAGLVDEIPDEALRAAEKKTFPDFPDVKGLCIGCRMVASDGSAGKQTQQSFGTSYSLRAPTNSG